MKPAQSRDPHFLGLPCPAAPWTPHDHTKERPSGRGQGIQPLEGIGVRALAPQPREGRALGSSASLDADRTLCCARRTLQSPPARSHRVWGLEDHACLPPASILPGRALEPTQALIPVCAPPRLEARRRVYGPGKAYKTLLQRVSARTPSWSPFLGAGAGAQCSLLVWLNQVGPDEARPLPAPHHLCPQVPLNPRQGDSQGPGITPPCSRASQLYHSPPVT